ncbi:tyrosine-type recombinase/integrase [Corallococcus sp. BB11-1]|uniref:tyrosine-type recombinase/integrase n=1 Tax=Corallococcus sp. BB11-1 TaxID=2996783 RepID=UPI002270E76B|nr:tyrosine-type recombinase/integrase [Corallococcus sp. BB11-1]MCY1036194.1 tyrosine-type recombinase/integrase [Corallococcus sp. BB11-1]
MSAYAAVTRPPRTLTEKEVALLLRATGAHKEGFRDHCLYSLALASGLREHELVALNIGDIFNERGRARRHVTLTVFKGSRRHPGPQEIVLSDTVRAKLEKLLRLKRAQGHDVGPQAPLFLSRKGMRLSTRQVRHGFAVWQERAGLERHLNFHAVRHTACTGVYRRTKDIRLTQRFARQRSIDSTVIYTHPSDDELVRVTQDLPC